MVDAHKWHKSVSVGHIWHRDDKNFLENDFYWATVEQVRVVFCDWLARLLRVKRTSGQHRGIMALTHKRQTEDRLTVQSHATDFTNEDASAGAISDERLMTSVSVCHSKILRYSASNHGRGLRGRTRRAIVNAPQNLACRKIFFLSDNFHPKIQKVVLEILRFWRN